MVDIILQHESASTVLLFGVSDYTGPGWIESRIHFSWIVFPDRWIFTRDECYANFRRLNVNFPLAIYSIIEMKLISGKNLE